MAGALLGEALDIHGGGADLQFPHHENEIAQSEGAHGGSFVRYWMHNGFVRVDNEKMSKSLGNFFTIRDVLRVFDPEVLRLFVLRAHYRSPINYSDAHLDDARASLLRLYTALTPGLAGNGEHLQPLLQPDWTTPSGQRFREAMDDDFNTPIAVSVLFDLASELNRTRDPAIERELRSLASVLGLLGKPPEQAVQSGLRGSDQSSAGLSDSDIDALVIRRTEAKKAKQFAQADQLRAELLAQGVILEDSPTGTRWRRS
jgi:cysteinyl-tRNA synthetase